MDSRNQTKSLEEIVLAFFERLVAEDGYLNINFGAHNDGFCIDTVIFYKNDAEKEAIQQWVKNIAKKSNRNLQNY